MGGMSDSPVTNVEAWVQASLRDRVVLTGAWALPLGARDKAIERGIFMASKRDTTYVAAEQQHNEVDYGDTQLPQDDD